MSTSNKKNVCDTCVLLVDYTDITITELGVLSLIRKSFGICKGRRQ